MQPTGRLGGLSCYVQNCVAVTLLDYGEEKHEILCKFELQAVLTKWVLVHVYARD